MALDIFVLQILIHKHGKRFVCAHQKILGRDEAEIATALNCATEQLVSSQGGAKSSLSSLQKSARVKNSLGWENIFLFYKTFQAYQNLSFTPIATGSCLFFPL
jgi:hypothetical protein